MLHDTWLCQEVALPHSQLCVTTAGCGKQRASLQVLLAGSLEIKKKNLKSQLDQLSDLAEKGQCDFLSFISIDKTVS